MAGLFDDLIPAQGPAPAATYEPPDMTSRYNTTLLPAQEQAYQEWLAQQSRLSGRDVSRDNYDYDLRGLFASGGFGGGNGHAGDRFKKPNHPTFSDQSQYHGADGYEGGRWLQVNDQTSFTPSATNIANMGTAGLGDYFTKVEPNVKLDAPQTGMFDDLIPPAGEQPGPQSQGTFGPRTSPEDTGYFRQQLRTGVENFAGSVLGWETSGALAQIKRMEAIRDGTDIPSYDPTGANRDPLAGFENLTPEQQNAQIELFRRSAGESMRDAHRNREFVASLPRDPAIAPFTNAKGWDKLSEFLFNPTTTSAVLQDAFVTGAPGMILPTAVSMLPGIGPGMAGLAFAGQQYGTRFNDQVLAEMAKDKIDPRDPAAVQAWMQNNPARLDDMKNKATAAASVEGAANAAMFGLPKILPAKDLVTGIGQGLAGALLGTFGMAGGDLIAHGNVDGDKAVENFITNLPLSLAMTWLGRARPPERWQLSPDNPIDLSGPIAPEYQGLPTPPPPAAPAGLPAPDLMLPRQPVAPEAPVAARGDVITTPPPPAPALPAPPRMLPRVPVAPEARVAGANEVITPPAPVVPPPQGGLDFNAPVPQPVAPAPTPTPAAPVPPVAAPVPPQPPVPAATGGTAPVATPPQPAGEVAAVWTKNPGGSAMDPSGHTLTIGDQTFQVDRNVGAAGGGVLGNHLYITDPRPPQWAGDPSIYAQGRNRAELEAAVRKRMATDPITPTPTSPASGPPGGAEPGQTTEVSASPPQTPSSGAVVPPPPTGTTSEAILPTGARVPVKHELVHIDDLVGASGDLQPRDREGRVASTRQIDSIKANFDPTQVIEGPYAERGAPIVGPDDIVESGNGRTEAMRQLFAEAARGDAGAQAKVDAYYAALKAAGYDAKVGEILVRRRQGDVTPEQRRQLVNDMNAPTGMGRSEPELARSDAHLITTDMLDRYSAANPTEFARELIGKLPANEHNTLMTGTGQLSGTGQRRVRNAVLARAYEDDAILHNYVDSPNPDMKGFGNALEAASPAWARMRDAVKAGDILPGMDVTTDLVRAMDVARTARTKGIDAEHALAQAQSDIFNPLSPAGAEIMRALYNPGMKRLMAGDKVAQVLQDYARLAMEQKVNDLFGGSKANPADLLKQARDKVQAGVTSANQGDLLSAPQGGTPEPKPAAAAPAAPATTPANENANTVAALEKKIGELSAKQSQLQDEVSALERQRIARRGQITRAEAAGDQAKVASLSAQQTKAVEQKVAKQTQYEALDAQRTKLEAELAAARGDTPPSPAAPAAAKPEAKAARVGPETGETAAEHEPVADRGQPNHRSASQTNEVAIQMQAFRDAGVDPNEALLWHPRKQYQVIRKMLVDEYGFKDVLLDQQINWRHAVDQSLNAYANIQRMMHAGGMSKAEASLSGRLTLMFGARVAERSPLGLYDPRTQTIRINDRANSFAHEWVHALDHMLHEAIGSGIGDGQLASRRVLRQGPGNAANLNTDTVEAFSNLLTSLFTQDKAGLAKQMFSLQQRAAARDAKGMPTSDAKLAGETMNRLIAQHASDMLKGAQHFTQPHYWTNPAEMFARAGEAWFAHNMAGNPDFQDNAFVTKGDRAYLNESDAALRHLYPKDTERNVIFHNFNLLRDALIKDSILGSGKPGSAPRDATAADIANPDKWRGKVPPTRDQGIIATLRRLAKVSTLDFSMLNKLIRTPRNFGREMSQNMGWDVDTGPNGNIVPRREQMQDMTHRFLMGSIGGRMSAIVARQPTLAARELMNKIQDDWDGQPGRGRMMTRPHYEEARERMSFQLQNQLFRALHDNGLADMPPAVNNLMMRLLTDQRQPGDRPTANMVKAAAEIRQVLNKAWYYGQNAGLEFGFEPNHMPRVYDHEKIIRNPERFVQGATKSYADQFDEMVAPFKGPDRQAKLEEIKKEHGLFPDSGKSPVQEAALRAEYAKVRANRWNNAIRLGQPDTFDALGPDSSFTRERSLPASADTHLADFMNTDVRDVLSEYMHKLTARAEYVRRVGRSNEGLENALAAAERQGAYPQDIAQMRHLIQLVAGRTAANQFTNTGFEAGLMYWGTLGLMTRAAVSSLGEPISGVMRTRSFGALGAGLKAMVQDILKTGDATDRRALGEALGVIASDGMEQIMASRMNAEIGFHKTRARKLNSYFHRTVLTPLTKWQRLGAIGAGEHYVRGLLDSAVNGKGERQRFAQYSLRELGIDPQGAEDLHGYMKAQGIRRFDVEQAMNTPEGQMWGDAVAKVSRQLVLSTERVDKPELAMTPYTRTLFGLQAYNQAFTRHFLGRMWQEAKNSPGFAGKLRYIAGSLPGIALVLATQHIIGAVRDALFGVDNPNLSDDEKAFQQKWQTLSRSSAFGTLDPIMQALMGLAYNRSLTQLLAPSQVGSFLTPAEMLMKSFINNSDKNNTAERNRVKAVMQLSAPAIASTLVAVPTAGPLLAGSVMWLTSAAGRDWAATALYGPPTKVQKAQQGGGMTPPRHRQSSGNSGRFPF